jgi:hypothetical protein
MDENSLQAEPEEDLKPRRSALFLCALAAAGLAAATVVVLLLIGGSPSDTLPTSDLGEACPETPVVIEVTKEGAATFRGSRVNGLQWPIFYHGGWDWLKTSDCWDGYFEPDMRKRTEKDIYGTGVPIFLTLNRDLKFAVPPPDVFTNVWLRVKRPDSSLLAGLSLCITDPNDEIEEERGNLFVFWRGERFEVPFEHGCLPVTILGDGRYGIRHDIRAIWLPRAGATDERRRVPVVNMNELPAVPYSDTALANLIESAGKGVLLCVDVEEGATVQQVVDFMSLCRKLDQPWTFYFHAASFE